MVRNLIFLSGLVILIGSASGISVSVDNTCNEDFEPLVSIENTDGGSVAEPDYYSQNVCVDDIEYSQIRDSCTSSERVISYLDSSTGGNLSIYDTDYSYRLCAPDIKSAVRNSCGENETKILSVESDHNTRAAAPSYSDTVYDQSLCLSISSPKNITLSISGLENNFYADGSQINTGEELTPPIDFPYISDDQPRGIVAYGEVIQISKVSTDTASMTLDSNTGSFLLPFTEGGYQEIEDERDEIIERNFLNMVSPNFGFEILNDPEVKIAYNSNRSLEGFSDRIGVNYNDLRIKNLGLRGNELKIDMSIQ